VGCGLAAADVGGGRSPWSCHLLAQQLLACGERVVDVQPKLAARVRLLNTGAVNKNDPNDARSVAVAALRSSHPREVPVEDQTAVLRLWARRYRDLGSARTQLVCRLHAVLCEPEHGGGDDRPDTVEVGQPGLRRRHQPDQAAPGIAALLVDATQIFQQYLGKLQACGVNGIAGRQATQHDSGAARTETPDQRRAVRTDDRRPTTNRPRS
jgi:Transposase